MNHPQGLDSAEYDRRVRHALDLGLDARAKHIAPGSIAAVCVRGQVRAVATHGSPRGGTTATTRQTVFRIASISKSFLSAAVFALRDKGLLDLHAPITQYVPYARARYRDSDAVITGAQLLSNRAGLSEDNAWADRHLGASREEIASLFRPGLALSARPGTTYQYSNLGQALLGRAVENVTGRPVEESVREILLEPLGLHRTAYVADAYPPQSLAVGFRTFDDGATFRAEPFVGSGALACIGSMFSTVDDIASWMWFLGSAFSDEPVRADVLAPESRLEMQQAHTGIPVSADPAGERELAGAGYGYGLVVEDDRRFGRIVQHSGGLPGFSAHMRWHVASESGVVVFGNSDEFGARRVAENVMRDLLHSTGAPSAVIRPWPQTVDAARRIDASLRRGTGATELPLLATNVLQDVPADVRDSRLAALRTQIGGIAEGQEFFEDRIVTAATEAQLRWRIAGVHGDLLVDLAMIDLPEPRVQSLTISAVETGGTRAPGQLPSAADHHRVEIAGVERSTARSKGTADRPRPTIRS
jgi:CubicO group peptidase (beta-lactamase class C family)